MITPQNMSQLAAFSRQDGVFTALYWAAGFFASMMSSREPALGMVSDLVVLGTPFFLGWRLKKFRDGALGGSISFRRAWLYCMETLVNAALVLGVAQYLYFRFADVSGFLAQWREAYKVAAQVYHLTAEQTRMMTEAMAGITPLAWASMFLLMEVGAGAVLAPILALLLRRPAPNRP